MDILISGAGIAGPALAYWLARQGFRPTVVERAPAVRTGGNGVDVRGPAIDVAERMGIMPGVRAHATDVVGLSFVDSGGRAVARLAIDPGSVEIMRGDLARLLADRTPGVEYLFGDTIRALEQDADGVTVTFERAGTRRFALVAGADGIHSTVRRLAFGPEERFLRHLGHYFAFADADPDLGEDRWMTMFNAPGRAAGIYRSGNHPGAKANLMFRHPYTPHPRPEDMLRNAFAGLPWHVPRLLEGVLADPGRYFDALCQVRMPSWHTGRVVLVGDAAYCASPVSGAGAMLALVGAHRLAAGLAEADGEHAPAFRRYEASMRTLAGKAQSGLFTGLIVPRTRAGIWARNTAAKLRGTLSAQSAGQVPRS